MIGCGTLPSPMTRRTVFVFRTTGVDGVATLTNVSLLLHRANLLEDSLEKTRRFLATGSKSGDNLAFFKSSE